MRMVSYCLRKLLDGVMKVSDGGRKLSEQDVRKVSDAFSMVSNDFMKVPNGGS